MSLSVSWVLVLLLLVVIFLGAVWCLLRSEQEKEFWGKRDPIKKLAEEIINKKFATEEELKSIEKKIDSEISESVKNALEAPEPPQEELTKYIWAED